MFKVKFTNVSSWKKETQIHTSGTRDKFILTAPNGTKYYFKKSLLKNNKDYKYEFWSEVIASQLGILLDFNVVEYHVAYLQKEIGCMSQSIIDPNKEELNEGYGYIVEKYPDFKNNFKKEHSFQKIIGSLKQMQLDHFIDDVIKMIVFDAVIGNTDRHSENWAIVVSHKKLDEAKVSLKRLNWYQKLICYMLSICQNRDQFAVSELNTYLKIHFSKYSPLYDNGSSLARELDNNKINELLTDENRFKNFINKGKPDIRWNDQHFNHFELIKAIKKDYHNEVNACIDKIKAKYKKEVLVELVNTVDAKLPSQFEDFRIPENRKSFLIKYIDARINHIINDNEQI